MIKKIKNKIKKGKLVRAQKREARKQHHYAIKNQPSAYDKAILSWIAPETVRHERGNIWKIVMTLIGLTWAAWAMYSGAWTLAVVIVAFMITYSIVHLEHPKDVEIKISPVGIKVGGRRYAYSRIKAFWVIYDPPFVKTLNIRVAGEIISDITIQLGNQSPAAVREVLISKIPEMEGATEKISDIFIRLFKI
jgi:hypothetical protein